MSQLLAILCSPKKNGVSATLAKFFLAGFQAAGATWDLIHLHDYKILPCQGCNACFKMPHQCILNNSDDTGELFTLMRNKNLLLFTAPIYFYALPAYFKALIDRGQIFYARKTDPKFKSSPILPPALVLLVAGRKRGKLIFEGAKKTLGLFLDCANSVMERFITFRGLENPSDIKFWQAFHLWKLGFFYGERCQKDTVFLR